MTPLERLLKSIDIASNIGIDSTLEDLDIAEDYAMTIGDIAVELEEGLLNEIYGVMEVKRNG